MEEMPSYFVELTENNMLVIIFVNPMLVGINMQELARRQASQHQGGFSLAFVLVIGLLSIILGCLVKK